MQPREFKSSLLSDLLAHAEGNYAETVRTTALLEDKAGKVAAVAGIFLPLMLGYLKAESFKQDTPFTSSFFLIALALTLVLLSSCIFLALRVLHVSVQADRISIASYQQLVGEFRERGDSELTQEAQDAVALELVSRWKDAEDLQLKVNESKAKWLSWSQRLLAAAGATVAAALFLVVTCQLLLRLVDAVISFFKG